MIELRKKNNFYVITGGPGVGKTTLIEELKKRNYNTVPEVARQLIIEQQENNGNALPWKDRLLYKEIMFERSIESYDQTSKYSENTKKPIFFDRSFLDTICYSRLIQSEINERMESYAINRRYNNSIFMLPPWEEIYETDSERKQDWGEAVLTFEKMRETYRDYGYNTIEVPKLSVNIRVDFILDIIDKS